jgi:putative hydrolases of HD superfamily
MVKNTLSPQQVLAFYREVEKLKTTLRHSWLNDGIRQESVAEHTWMMTLLALVLAPQLSKSLDLLKAIKMIVIHDLAEAITKDMPVWQGVKDKKEKTKQERAAIFQIFAHLGETTKKDLTETWEEYEKRSSPEAIFVKAIDTLDVIVQHNVAPLSTWDDNDYLWQLSPLQNSFFDKDEFLRKVKDEIDRWSIEKVSQAKNLHKLDQVELKKRLEK